ncbi:hypothetical protein PL2TA16_02599 [Pseudoalteromonas luteoviolacea 2ta16]|uniref:Uncharacterized protein n=1 Tax=Pseudoalteromonas luteoviolacea (strain 2ta16) TaxID=1353533 RepID=V4HW25_PSEL2|nr:hypothetical protein PL2TA16_02599 [Pseudoalteromonas luteoviolacea 2ta16]
MHGTMKCFSAGGSSQRPSSYRNPITNATKLTGLQKQLRPGTVCPVRSEQLISVGKH